MLIVALTGGIASGKSVVAEVWKNLGCYIHHADKAAHELMRPGMPAWKGIKEHFGDEILADDQTINRPKLASIIFTNKLEQLFLNSLLHPLVISETKELVRKLRRERKHKIFVSEAALTVEAGFTSFFDRIVVVYCTRKVQLKRLMHRDKISKSAAISKLNSQLNPDEKLKYADYTIDTSGDLESTIENSEKVYRFLLSDYELQYANKRTG